ncbi:acyl-CoA dehydratase activase-related protein [Tissierella sp. Yu-01]|uniref:acyl-CoA dehydratase activase-related protein n=1 Tax=Tissierella sp. Yu-01 TaxID=3035694 RepID=UPI00240DF1DF|nr:acyl-CoA dehydratase activase-related protein [Tissierella sp. Yu-01]WFA08761.1 acyl-CoA dehydratase activase [Tissierella sp. Yu-01]
MKIGLDVGSTTLKCVVIDDNDNLVFHSYDRHYSQITEKTASLLKRVRDKFPKEQKFNLCISGSAGMGLSESNDIPFIQEVYATRIAVKRLIPHTDVVIELGGEDAKILFLTDGMEVRMNGSCAGGTGAFIDQMATLLNLSLVEMNELAKDYSKIYTIASRCGVFAKSDVQPLLNQGANKNDISASIFAAVVNQTIAGLAQGREIKGQVVYLGGPLTFFSELRESFDRILNLNGICPENSLYFVAMGAAFTDLSKEVDINETINRIENYKSEENYASTMTLFDSKEDCDEFIHRHSLEKVDYINPNTYKGNAYLGIDAGSTTVKAAVISADEEILYSEYLPNSGNPVPIIKNFLLEFFEKYPDIKIKSSAVTGYGEEIIKNAFKVDFGIVETIAHYTAAKKFKPDVDFIIDIGGQDIKCFKIRNGVIDNIFLNEACSSGCGSFLQTFAGALDYSIEDFAKLGLKSTRPVDLGSRCTVFMNSQVKQAQKDGASIEDISAGLSISVVKNALYKVIRASSADSLGENIVVQGGTFHNDVVLRAFERELKRNVVRPNISGLMGAYGAALYSKENEKNESDIITKEELGEFVHIAKVVNCGLCNNNCKLTVNTFNDNRKFIGGNRCERPIATKNNKPKYNVFDYKLSLLEEYKPVKGSRGQIGIPMGLNMYELLPFWHTLFTALGFEVITSPTSNRDLYLRGQHTIPSDTVCFPAKLIHGHIEYLLDSGVETIFYPCLTYNINEKKGDNHYNCPVVAYYPEVIKANVMALENVKFIYDYFGIHRKKNFTKTLHKVLQENFGGISFVEVKNAVEKAYEEYDLYMSKIRNVGKNYIELAEANDMQIIVLAGRPYHIDPEVNHGIAKLITEFGVAVVTEDSISDKVEKFETDVLNQWTYHARLYAAAKYINDKPNMNLVQLVSFGCGLDAVTTDEVQRILEREGKIYTQIKIDEITNLGAVKIRLRSLLAAIDQRREEVLSYA